MKIKCRVLLAALLSLPAMVGAQGENLLDNGSFEAVTGKPKKLGQIELAVPWVSPTGARADVFIGGSKIPEIGAPDNFYGTESAAEGGNYAGIMAFSFGDKAPRTYIMAKLGTPLKKGMKYCVRFNLVLSETSKYASNQIGAKFTSKAFATEAKSSIIDEADVLHPSNKLFNAMFGWEKVCGTYIAEGGEKYITIGNFSSNEDTRNERMKMPATFKGSNTTQVVGAYYYIDDVSVTLLDEETPCDCGVEEGPVELPKMIYSRQIVNNKNMTATQKVEAQTMFFAFGKATLTDDAMATLDFIITELKANPTMNVTVNGYGDTFEKEMSGKKEQYSNMDSKRVKAVTDYLIAKGISPSRIQGATKGNDATNPDVMAGDDKEMTLAKNRRVTLTVN